MTAKELADELKAAGVDDATIGTLMNNATFQQKAQGLARQSELATIQARAQTLETSYAKAKNYEDWYAKHYPTIAQQNVDLAAYQERYGDINANANGGNAQPQGGQPRPQGGQPQAQPQGRMSKAEIQAEIDERMLNKWGGEVRGNIMDTGKIVETHMRNKREGAVDWNEIQRIAAENGGNLEQAYATWDKPHRDADAEKALTARAKAMADQEVERRMLALNGQGFPAGAGSDYGYSTGAPSPLSPVKADGTPKVYDRNAILQAANEVLHSPDYKPYRM